MPDKDTFTDVKFMTAKEKELTLKAWVTFLKHGCKMEHFTERLYHHLMQHCSFIAHYNRGGFYDTYFLNGDDKAKFMSQFDESQFCRSVEYGDSRWYTDPDYEDLNRAMVRAAKPYIKRRSWIGYLLVPAVTVPGLPGRLENDALSALANSPQVESFLKENGGKSDIQRLLVVEQV
jgi:hypothetical protein